MMTKTLMAALALAAGLALPSLSSAADKPVLTVYTYDSFAADWGPGPVMKKGFEKTCGCILKFVGVDSSIGAFNRIRLEGADTKADVLLGLDVNLVGDARASGLFQPNGVDLSGLKTPIKWNDPVFAPFDWGHFAFVYDSRKMKDPPHSFEDLINAPASLKIAIQDPRSATPGLGLVMWVRAAYGDKAPEIWKGLKPHVLTVTKSWWDAYSLFLKGEADMALSYTTSPAYHEIEDKTDYIKAARFKEGHYLQMELAAITKASKHPKLAKEFIAYLVGPEAQAVIPTTNWMFPVNPAVKLPDAFHHLIEPVKTLAFSAKDASAHRKAWIDEWLNVMGN